MPPVSQAGAGAAKSPERLVLHYYQSPGDTLVSTAAVASLQQTYPGKYQIDVEGTASVELFEHSPYVTRGMDRTGSRTIRMENPLINESHLPVHFLASYCKTLSRALGVDVPLKLNRPDLHVSEQEKGWIPRIEELTGARPRYWVLNAGSKQDFQTKQIPLSTLAEVIDRTKDRITWVQVGEASPNHNHVPLDGAINEIGKTDLRQLVRLVYWAEGVVTPESLLWHMAAALQKPAVCVASGFLPVHFVSYPTGRILHAQGQLSCCRKGACWKGKLSGSGGNVCQYPCEGVLPYARCMGSEFVTADEIVRTIERFSID